MSLYLYQLPRHSKTLFIIATALNITDLLMSFIAFHYGYVESNPWMNYVHNSYIACFIAIAIYQSYITIVYYLSRRYWQAGIFLIVFTIQKSIAPILNIITLIESF